MESFYAQHQLESLNINDTVLEEMLNAGSKKTEMELRSLLGCFLFSGDDVEKKIKVLSGGEKARVALAKTIVSKANFLLLDEPTNHLDMHSVNLLIEALNKYQGSLLLVSHDRYFVQRTANKIWEIDENHQVKEFVGTYEEWMEWKAMMAARAASEAKASTAPLGPNGRSAEPKGKVAPAASPASATSASPATSAKANAAPVPAASKPVPAKPINKDLQKQQRRFEQVEKDLAKLTEKKAQLEADLGAPDVYADRNKFVQAEKAYQECEAQWKALNKEYEELFEKMMEMGGKS
jgi:ATP-binding cassette subfamily F protein 3